MIGRADRREIKMFVTYTKGLNNRWFLINGLEIYLRKGFHSIPGIGAKSMLDIANVSCSHPGQGAFTEVLTFLEDTVMAHCNDIYGIYVENLVNERLIHFMEKRGYIQILCTQELAPCMFKVINQNV